MIIQVKRTIMNDIETELDGICRALSKWVLPVAVLLLTACGGVRTPVEQKEDLTAKALLQGIWLDEEDDMPWIKVEGDTLFYADTQNAPATFRVVHDSIYVTNAFGVMAYKIERQTEYSFWFCANEEDGLVKLYKSEDVADNLFFKQKQVEILPSTPEVVKKDSIIFYQGNRYRGYVHINPSTMKVQRTTFTENGVAVDNIYYDNVIYICVYQGTQMLYGKNIQKQQFSTVLPEEYLNTAVLTDMDFVGVNEEGFRFKATLTVPETQVFVVLYLTIQDGEIRLSTT